MSFSHYDDVLPLKLEYNNSTFNIVDLVKNLFNNTPLDSIHETLRDKYDLFDKPVTDSATVLHKIFYDKLRSGWDDFLSIYKSLIVNYCDILNIKENDNHSHQEFIYQKWPTFRVHLPNNLAVGAWHTDNEYFHPEGEINFILPLTKMYESNTVITESIPGARDFKQIELDVGQLFAFHGNKCLHGNLPNRTGKTRMSLDFRILYKKDYENYLLRRIPKSSYKDALRGKFL